jgi:Ni/Co efflux regulator RcnB
MKSKVVVSGIMAIALASAGFAVAQDHGYRNDRGREKQMERRDYRQDQRGDWRRGDRNEGARPYGRAAGPDRGWRRGDRLPAEYRHRQYVVDDWRGHHLRAPPRGYHWVQRGGDYILVAIASGVILELLLNH